MTGFQNINFHKYHGTGNDFILIDNRAGEIVLNNAAEIARLCHRRFGIGADGLILLEKSVTKNFKMVYYNSDGKPSSMCGNGGRCITVFASSLGLVKDVAIFEAIDGEHHSKIIHNSGKHPVVSLKMNDVNFPVNDGNGYVLNTGSPHYVEFSENLKELDVFTEGRKIRYSSKYKDEGINVNFMSTANGSYMIRTYERGVEDETWSCGTGTVAGALVLDRENKTIANNSVHLITKGGTLSVAFKKSSDKYTDIWLTGEVEKVYEGNIEINRP